MASIPSSNIVQKWSGGSAWGSWSSDQIYVGYDSSSHKNYVACVRIQMPAAGISAQFNIKYNYAYSVEQGQKLKYKVTTTAQDSTYVNANSSTAGDATVNMVQGNGTITINYNSSFASGAYIYVYIWTGVSTSYYTQGKVLAVSNHSCTYTEGTASTVSIGSGTYVGDTCSISIARNNSSFTHTLTWKFGTKTGTIATGVGTSYSFSTSSIASTMSAGIPNANQGTLTVYCTTYNGSTQIGSATSATRTLSLKASTISASGSTIGSAVTLTCARSYSDVTHTLTWSFGGSTGSIASGVGTSQSWTPATATFAPLIPSATSGSCTVTCTTKHGTATVGSNATTFTLYLPDSVKPSVSSGWYSIAYDNSSAPYPTSGWACYIQGYSKAKATFTPSKVSAGTGSSISKYRLSIAGSNYDTTGTTATSATLPSSGTVTYTVYVYDARGRYASASGSVTVQAYASPAITSYNIFRCNSSGVADSAGAYFSLTANSTISSVNGNNVRTFQYQMQEVGGSWSEWEGYTNGSTAILGDGTLQAAKSYVVQLRLKDSFATTVYATATIPTDNVTFNLKDGGKGAAFGMYSQTDNLLQLADTWQLNPGKGIVGYKRTFKAYKNVAAVGWYSFLKFGIGNDGGVRGNRSFVVDITITRSYSNGNNETHSVRLLAVYDVFTFTSEESRTNGHYITQVRYARNGNDGYLQLYYNSTNNNEVQVDCVVSRCGGEGNFSEVQLERADNYTALVTKSLNAQCFPVFTTRTDGWPSAVKTLTAAPTETPGCFYPFTVGTAFTLASVQFPLYAKGVYLCSGSDAIILAVTSGNPPGLRIAFRNGSPGTWYAKSL